MLPALQQLPARVPSQGSEASGQSAWSCSNAEQLSPSQLLADLDEARMMAAPEEPPPPEPPPPQEFAEPPKAPELPEPPAPPEVKVESDAVAGWPKWLVEELEVRVSEEERARQVDEEAPRLVPDFSQDAGFRDTDHSSTDSQIHTARATCASNWMARFPLMCALGLLIVFLTPIAVGIWGIPFMNVNGLALTIETTFDSFLQTDVQAAVALRSFDQARNEKPAATRRLQGSGGQPYSAYKDLILYYELEEDHGLPGGLLARHTIVAIMRFEQRLRALPSWQRLCNRTETGSAGLCDPGVSLAGYVGASWQKNTSEDLEPQALRFDGGGMDPLNLPTALHFLERHGMDSVVLPVGVNATPEVPEVRLLRSVFRFKVYCCDQDSSSTAMRRDFNQRTMDEWEYFIRHELIPLFRRGPGRGVRVSFDGSQFNTIEVHMALMDDVRFALGTVVFVHVYLLCHTRSVLLSLAGPLLSALALPLAFTVCGFVFGSTSVNFASALALFLTVGFGADVVLVYTDFWRASAKNMDTDSERLAWTFKQAGGASFATTATTALSFFANLASAIRALRRFAFLMGLCVVFAWILISLVYTPLCIVNERVVRCLCPKRMGVKLATAPGLNSHLLSKKVNTLRAGRYLVLLLSAVALGVFVGVSAPQVEMGTALPQIFPDGHNREHVQGLDQRFARLSVVFGMNFQAPRVEESVCSKEASRAGDPSCALHWCVAGTPANIAGLSPDPLTVGCSCWRGRLSADTCSASSSVVRGVTRLVGVEDLTSQQLTEVAQNRVAASSAQSVSLATVNHAVLRPLVLQDWLSGAAHLRHFTEATGDYRRSSATAPGSAAQPGPDGCDWQDLCFCSNASFVCELPGSWTQLADFQFPGVVSAPRSLGMVPATLPEFQQTKVTVAFGLWITDTTPLLGDQGAEESWGYINNFDPRDPWVQRMMLKFCDELPLELAVVSKWCWIEDFHDWLHQRGHRFPTQEHEFDSLALEFADTGGIAYGTSGRRYIWVEENRPRAFYFTFMIDVPKDSRASVSLEFMGYWNAYVQHFKDLAKAEGRGKLGIFHTSALWAEAEAESELLRSTVVTIAIVLGLACLGMLVFTRSLVLSLYVVVATVQSMAGLFFFVTVVMGWTIGLVEVVALIYFVGYAVTYPLHVAHKYADPESRGVQVPAGLRGTRSGTRYQRTKWALRSIGGAALGSAMTTAGASAFLVFCTLTVFVKLGAMCLVVTVASILTALGPLPAALLTFGPPKPGLCHGD